MSDDETDTETPPTRRECFINAAHWRDMRITTAMRYLDGEMLKFRRECAPGNTAHIRKFSSNVLHLPSIPLRSGKTTVKGAKKGLPQNYYDFRWLSSLELQKLDVKPPVEWDGAKNFR
jgi:hypothetical protein